MNISEGARMNEAQVEEFKLREEAELSIHDIQNWSLVDDGEWGLAIKGTKGPWTIIVTRLPKKDDESAEKYPATVTAKHENGKLFAFPTYWATITHRRAQHHLNVNFFKNKPRKKIT